jgi:hypothetical protein
VPLLLSMVFATLLSLSTILMFFLQPTHVIVSSRCTWSKVTEFAA